MGMVNSSESTSDSSPEASPRVGATRSNSQAQPNSSTSTKDKNERELTKDELYILKKRFEMLRTSYRDDDDDDGVDTEGRESRGVSAKLFHGHPDPFCQQLWKRQICTVQQEGTQKNQKLSVIPFSQFSTVAERWQNSPVEAKLEGLFQLIKTRDVISITSLGRILPYVLPEVSEEDCQIIASHMVTMISTDKKSDHFSREEFMLWLTRSLKDKELLQALDFRITNFRHTPKYYS